MILLDTCSFLWLVSDPYSLSKSAQSMLDEIENKLFVSSISALEIGLKQQKTKLNLPKDLSLWFNESILQFNMEEIFVNSVISILSSKLPLIHKDPFDRILIATAQIHKLTLLTPDPLIRQYPNVKVEW